MPIDEIESTGVATAQRGSREGGWLKGCWQITYNVELLGHTPLDTLNGAASETTGIERLYGTTRMATPDGIRIGSPARDVQRVYGTGSVSAGDFLTVPASPKSYFRILIGPDGFVASLEVQVRKPICQQP